jgi:malate dehydrogenase (oxaloacetate-decarboxylating)
MTTTAHNSTASDQNSQSPITDEEIFAAHEGGKLSAELTSPLQTQRDLSIAYTPGVAKVCTAIKDEPQLARTHTWTGRLVAVVSDGSAVLGLGDIGPQASLPVMEGKCALFKSFSGLNAIPIVLDTNDTDEIVETIIRMAPTFGAINLEDISAPRCFEIEDRVKAALDIPVMHDDQHGTAVVVLAALTNALRVVEKSFDSDQGRRLRCRCCRRRGGEDPRRCRGEGHRRSRLEGHCRSRPVRPVRDQAGHRLSPRIRAASPAGSARPSTEPTPSSGYPAAPSPRRIWRTWPTKRVIFGLSNPTPEVAPDIAAKYATVVATGRSDFPNQINNVLAFPGIFRGALDADADEITDDMKLVAARAIADLVGDDLAPGYIVPGALDSRVAPAVAEAVETLRAGGDDRALRLSQSAHG